MKKKIFILHGWAYDTEKWKPVVKLLEEKGLDIDLLKIPGLTAPLNEEWNLDNYVAWLKEIVGKEKGKVILLGHSNGGRIALAFTTKYPEKIEKLFLIDSAGIYHNEFPLRAKRLIFGTLAKVGKGVKNVAPIRKVFYRFVKEHDYEKANPLLRETMKNLINEDLSEVIKQITLPTVIIWGENDKMTPLTDGKQMHQSIKDSTFHVIQDARHSPQFSHVKEVADVIYANL